MIFTDINDTPLEEHPLGAWIVGLIGREGTANMSVADFAKWAEGRHDYAHMMEVEGEVRKLLVREEARQAFQQRQVETADTLNVLTLDDLKARPRPDWLIEGVLQGAGVIMLAGEAGLGKTFVTLDWAASIATGTDWHGHATKQGNVIYVAGEGAEFMPDRLDAWQEASGTHIDPHALRFIDEGFNLGSPGAVDQLAKIVKRDDVSLVVIDTLSQLSAYESENDAAQLAATIRAARDIRQANPGASIILVHHVNKSEKKRVRGSSAIRGNVDILWTALGTSSDFRLSTRPEDDGKMKNAPAAVLSGFALQDCGPSAVVVQSGSNPVHSKILAALSDGEWHPVAEVRGTIAPKTFERAVKALGDQLEASGSTRSRKYRLNRPF